MSLLLMLAGGLVALVLGGDLLVRGATSIARRFGVSPLLIGLTLVGFGTSTPELVTSLQAAFTGSPGVAIGNVVGSNTANILLILGASALIAPIAVSAGAFKRDGTVLAASALLCLFVVLWGRLEPLIGVFFVACLVAYVVFSVRHERRAGAVSAAEGTEEEAGEHVRVAPAVVKVLIGLGATILGARWLVTAAVELASSLGVSETVIGLTVVAVGTSLPELVTSFAAARRRQGDIAFGNIVGSNIYNVLFILGATAVIKPIDVPAAIAGFDIWVMLGATAALTVAAVTSWRITRSEGAALLGAYVAYTGWLVFSASAG